MNGMRVSRKFGYIFLLLVLLFVSFSGMIPVRLLMMILLELAWWPVYLSLTHLILPMLR